MIFLDGSGRLYIVPCQGFDGLGSVLMAPATVVVVGEVMHQRGSADGLGFRNAAGFPDGGIDDQLDVPVFDMVHHVGPSLPDLVDRLVRKAGLLKKPEVPRVARILKPILYSFSAMEATNFLSRSRTLMKTAPSRGRFCPAASWDLAKAMPKSRSMPITSPVDFISGPSRVSTSGETQ